MVDEFEYISLREVISRVTRHPMLQDVDLETAIQYTIDFFGNFGFPALYEDKLACVDIHKFRGELPCDVVRIEQVRNAKTKVPLRAMTATFNTIDRCIPSGETFKTHNRIITTSFPEGKVDVAYKAIKVDCDGVPMIPDNPVFLQTLELYIKKERFGVLFDLGKVRGDIMEKTERDYYAKSRKLASTFKVPSVSEMQSITGIMHRLIPSSNEFYAGFKGLGDVEHFRRH